MNAAEFVEVAKATIDKMQISQTRLIADVIEIEARKYATGELPRVSPQIALEALAKAINGMADKMEAKRLAEKAVTQ